MLKVQDAGMTRATLPSASGAGSIRPVRRALSSRGRGRVQLQCRANLFSRLFGQSPSEPEENKLKGAVVGKAVVGGKAIVGAARVHSGEPKLLNKDDVDQDTVESLLERQSIMREGKILGWEETVDYNSMSWDGWATRSEEEEAVDAFKQKEETPLPEAMTSVDDPFEQKVQNLISSPTEAISSSVEEETALPEATRSVDDDAFKQKVQNLISSSVDILEEEETALPDAMKSVDDAFKQQVKNLISSSAQAAAAPSELLEEKRHDTRSNRGRRVPFQDDGTCKAEGSGHEVLLQAFNWESHKQNWYKLIGDKAQEIKESGFTLVWMPPASHSVSHEGYMPVDYYDLNSFYGSKEELKEALEKLHGAGLGALADIVINHRCASFQDEHGVWNKFGGKMAWDQRAIVGNDPNFRGQGHHSNDVVFHAAPNIDHRQEFVREDIKEWLRWLHEEVGFDGWRFDFAKGYGGEFVGEYVEATTPLFAVGEFWDTLSYSGASLDPNQDSHRQRTVDWINASGGRSLAFDMTTKGILHAVIQNGEYWRLSDQDGRPPGILGYWPSRTCTFIENHDTGSTQGHWRFPEHGIEQGYAYILTHPGTPAVFWDHYMSERWQPAIKKLIQIRKENGINCRSRVHILKADSGIYAAQIDDRLIVKIGPHRNWQPSDKSWEKTGSGHGWCVWRLDKGSREIMDTILNSSFLPEAESSGGDDPDAKHRIFQPPAIQHDD